jgi:peptide deformylase
MSTQIELVEPKHPAMRQPATVDPFSLDVNWPQQEERMIELMRSRLGIGLAAPQIGEDWRMFVMAHSVLGDIGVYNPEILDQSEARVREEEGCLSWPLLYVGVKRPESAKVRFTMLKDGQPTVVETTMTGMDARVFLHEFEHLEGRNYLERVSDFRLRRALEARNRRLKSVNRLTRRLTRGLE